MVGTYLATLAGLQDSDFFQKAKVNKKKKEEEEEMVLTCILSTIFYLP